MTTVLEAILWIKNLVRKLARGTRACSEPTLKTGCDWHWVFILFLSGHREKAVARPWQRKSSKGVRNPGCGLTKSSMI